MIIACPNCSARFVADPQALLPNGRTVRCGNCGTTWHQPPAEAPAPPMAAAPARIDEVATTPVENERQKRVKKRRLGRVLSLFLLVFLLAAIAGGLYKYRDAIVERFPAAAAWYEKLGLAVARPAGYGLHVPKETVRTERSTEGGVPILIVSGTIVNETAQPQKTGRMQLVLLDGEGKALRDWIFTPPEPAVEPGKSVPFKTSVRDPPGEARNISIRFIIGNN